MEAPPAALGMTGILAQLANAVQAYIAKLGGARCSGSSPTTQPAGTAAFTNVSLSSAGDPHLAISGTEQNADGTTASVSSTFDSMTGHANLFSTNDFGDGFTVATTVTAPNASGVTLNASATATMNGGLDSVTMTGNGAVLRRGRGGHPDGRANARARRRRNGIGGGRWFGQHRRNRAGREPDHDVRDQRQRRRRRVRSRHRRDLERRSDHRRKHTGRADQSGVAPAARACLTRIPLMRVGEVAERDAERGDARERVAHAERFDRTADACEVDVGVDVQRARCTSATGMRARETPPSPRSRHARRSRRDA